MQTICNMSRIEMRTMKLRIMKVMLWFMASIAFDEKSWYFSVHVLRIAGRNCHIMIHKKYILEGNEKHMSKTIFSRSIVSTKVVNCLPQALLLWNKEVEIKNSFGSPVCNISQHTCTMKFSRVICNTLRTIA